MKNNIKKATAIILSLLMALSLSACGGVEAGENQILVGDHLIDAEVFKYYYYFRWKNYQDVTFYKDSVNEEGQGVKSYGYDYSRLPFEQEYDDKFSRITTVTAEELGVEKPTWQDVFVYLVFEGIIQLEYAEKKIEGAEIEVTEEQRNELENIIAEEKKGAQEAGLSFEEYLKQKYGSELTEEELRSLRERIYKFLNSEELLIEKQMSRVTDEEKQEEYESAKETYDSYGDTAVGDVRHLLIKFPRNEETGEFIKLTDSEKKPYMQKAQELLDKYNENPTEDNFTELVKEYSEDSSASIGGLFTEVANDNSYVEEFEEWSTDPARQVGDVEIIETVFGYHIMYFSKTYGDAKNYFTTKAVAKDKHNEEMRTEVRKQISGKDLRSEKIMEITEKQGILLLNVIRSDYRLEENEG